MSNTPSSTAPTRLSTGDVMERVRALLASVDHDGRSRLDADARLALVTDAVAVARQMEALRAVLVAEADQARASEAVRGASLRSVLATSAQVTAGEASGWVYAGKELIGRRGVRDAALAGEVSVAQARAIDKVMGDLPATLTQAQRTRAEDIMLAKARRLDAKGLAGQGSTVLAEVAPEVDAVECELSRLEAQRRQAWAARAFTLVPDGRGSMLIRGQLPLLEGEAFSRLVAAYTQSNRRASEGATDRHDEGLRTPAQRAADGLMALVGAHVRGRRASDDGRPGAGVVVTMSLDALQARGEQAGLISDGQVISAGELRQVLCDSAVIPVVLGGTSEPLDVGRERRLVTPQIRRALVVRDGGCAFPGCEVAAHACEAHHVRPWWAGGATALENLVLLCAYHHGVVEPPRFWSGSPRWRVEVDAHGHPRFHAPTPLGRSDVTPRFDTNAD